MRSDANSTSRVFNIAGALLMALLISAILVRSRRLSPTPGSSDSTPTPAARQTVGAAPSPTATLHTFATSPAVVRTADALATQEAVATLSVGLPPEATFTSTATPAGPSPEPTATPTLLAGRAPRLPRQGVHFITHGDRQRPLVALTFDLCQAPAVPSRFDHGIYEALLQADAPATFFAGGDWMRTHITETRLLAAQPLFEIGNHSWSHPDMRDLDEADMAREVLRAQDMLYQITGRQSVLWRFPAGLYNDLALSVVAFYGLYSIQWDVVTADPVPDNTADNILRLVHERTQNGSIIVMHANGRGWNTAEALPEMIEYLRGEGYCLVTVSQLIGLEPVPESCSG